MTSQNLSLGKTGEDLAHDYLAKLGYKFLTSNFRHRPGEIDLIFKDRQTIVFVEVKTRRAFAQGLPEEAVTPRKLALIQRVGEYYLISHGLESSPARIDVIAIDMTVSPPHIRHIPNASQ